MNKLYTFILLLFSVTLKVCEAVKTSKDKITQLTI